MPNKLRIKDIGNLKEQKVLFDANVWLFIFGPIYNSVDRRVREYSRAYGSMLKSDNKIIVEPNVISEFCNRYARIVHSTKVDSGEVDNEFKRFRNSEDFTEVGCDIADNVQNIIDECEFDALSDIEYDFAEIFDEYRECTLDYNDILIRNLCRSRGYFLLTDDRDFAGSGIDLISGNPRVLA